MIIQCDNCSTKFRLDDSKVTDAGVRVRCSRCSHTFIVRKEEPGEETFDTLLAGFGGPAGEDGTATGVEGAEGAGSEGEDAPKESSGDVCLAAAGSGESEGGQAASGEEDSGEAEAPAAPSGGFFREGVGLPQFSMDRLPETPVEEGSSEIPKEESPGDMGRAEEAAAPAEPAADPDLSEQPMESAGESADSPLPASPTKEDWGILNSVETPTEKEPAVPAPGFSADNADESELPPLTIASRRRGSPLTVLLLAVLAVLIVAVICTSLFLKWPIDPATVLPPSVMGKLGVGAAGGKGAEMRNLNGDYLVNREAGEILAITGQVFNASGKPLTSLRVTGTVYDGSGQVLAQRTVYCGNSLTREQLADRPFADLEKAMGSQFGDNLANLDLAPGKSIPFVIVFKRVPAGARGYGVKLQDPAAGEVKK